MKNKADESKKLDWYGMLTECRKRMSVSDMARKLGKSLPSVRKWLKEPDALPRGAEELCKILSRLLEETRFLPNPYPRQRLWQSLRIKRVVGSHELAGVSLTDMSTAYRFLRLLTKSGYLQKYMPRRKNEGSMWRLVKDTGPKVPEFTSTKQKLGSQR